MEEVMVSGRTGDGMNTGFSGQEGDFLPLEYVDNENGRKMIMMVLLSLPVKCQITLLARYYMKFDFTEMANVLETSSRRAKMYLDSAETMLKWRLEEQLGRELPYVYCADREPMLARLYRNDAATVVTPSVLEKLGSFVCDQVRLWCRNRDSVGKIN